MSISDGFRTELESNFEFFSDYETNRILHLIFPGFQTEGDSKFDFSGLRTKLKYNFKIVSDYEHIESKYLSQ